MSELFDFEGAETFAVGAVGEPGERVFLIQVRRAGETLTMKLEKQEVAALVEYFARVLKELHEPVEAAGETDLDGNPKPEFVVGSLAVSYDEESDRIVVVAEERTGEDEGEGSSARISVTRQQAAAFAMQGRRAVEAGRPACPFCGYPLDARGHVCPRMNGHRPPLT